MGVGVERDRHVGVAQPLLDDPWVDAGAQGEGGVGVAEVVQADPG